MKADLLEQIKKICQNTEENVPMAKYTTFRIGGAAEVLCEPESREETESLVSLLKDENEPYTVIGNGSNLLVSDAGIDGVVIRIAKRMKKAEVLGETISAEAGILLSELSSIAAKAGLTGLEFASGIPGTLGGAIYMNAGAYGGEIGTLIETVTYLSEDGEIKTAGREELFFGYRKSSFSENGGILLGCTLTLSKGNEQEIRAKMQELSRKRAEKQPLSYPSAGSAFKRPEGHFAGALIEESGLKGFRIGGAGISEKHAGFLVNYGGATAKDVRAVIRHVQKTVQEKSGVFLEPEIRMIGREE